jgi:hypothetical protein
VYARERRNAPGENLDGFQNAGSVEYRSAVARSSFWFRGANTHIVSGFATDRFPSELREEYAIVKRDSDKLAALNARIETAKHVGHLFAADG